jgi:hypothetical protein
VLSLDWHGRTPKTSPTRWKRRGSPGEAQTRLAQPALQLISQRHLNLPLPLGLPSAAPYSTLFSGVRRIRPMIKWTLFPGLLFAFSAYRSLLCGNDGHAKEMGSATGRGPRVDAAGDTLSLTRHVRTTRQGLHHKTDPEGVSVEDCPGEKHLGVSHSPLDWTPRGSRAIRRLHPHFCLKHEGHTRRRRAAPEFSFAN